MRRHPRVGAFEESHELTVSVSDASIASSGAAFAALLDVDDPAQVRLEHCFQFRSIGRAVVNDDRFKVAESLRKYGIEALCDQLRRVIARDYDADSRSGL